MKIAYINDIHVDLWVKQVNPQDRFFRERIDRYVADVLNPKDAKADVLIIAGDLGHYFSQDCATLLSLKEWYKHIILVEGNHSRYLISSKAQHKYNYNSQNKVDELKDWCTTQDNIHYLDGNTIKIDGIIFGGLGMAWDGSYGKTNFGMSEYELLELYKVSMNDSRYIFQDGDNHRKYTHMYGKELIEYSFKPLEFFEKQKALIDSIKQVDVMVTHYPPFVAKALPEMYKNETTSFFTWDGVDTINRLKPKLWFTGHQHFAYDEEYLGSRFICNPLGYSTECLSNTGIKVVDS